MARLIDTVTVNPDDGRAWRHGYEATARECNVQVEFAEACEETYIPLVGDVTSFGPGQYKVVPFPIQGFLRQSVFCQDPDDGSWFREAFDGLTEYALTRALVIQAVAGTESWIGDDSVQVQALAGVTDAQMATALSAGRELWFSTVVEPEGVPIMHVPPSLVSQLVRIGWLFVSDSGIKSVLGDKVVVGAGYEANPHVFFTGSIIVRLNDIKLEEDLIHARINDSTIAVDRLGMIDVAPCSIVKVGA